MVTVCADCGAAAAVGCRSVHMTNGHLHAGIQLLSHRQIQLVQPGGQQIATQAGTGGQHVMQLVQEGTFYFTTQQAT